MRHLSRRDRRRRAFAGTAPAVIAVAAFAITVGLLALACVALPAEMVFGLVVETTGGYIPATVLVLAYVGGIVTLCLVWARVTRRLR